jgi:hypothetical protein
MDCYRAVVVLIQHDVTFYEAGPKVSARKGGMLSDCMRIREVGEALRRGEEGVEVGDCGARAV